MWELSSCNLGRQACVLTTACGCDQGKRAVTADGARRGESLNLLLTRGKAKGGVSWAL